MTSRKASRAKTKATKAVRSTAGTGWLLYVLRCGDGTWYCGITNDLPRRLAAHRAGRGARYTRGRGPLRVLGAFPMQNLSAALRAEAAFKKLDRRRKRLVVRSGGLFPS